jgi:PAS domain S-box-containing protein
MLRGISELTTDLIYVKDRDSRLVFANPATLKAFGMAEAAVVGTSLAERPVAPAEAAAIIANDRRIMAAGETETVEEVYTGASGTRTYLSTKTPMRDELGEVVGIVGISHDITEGKRVGALLAGQKGVLEMIATGLPLREVLIALVRTVEALDPHLLCSVLLLDLDGKRVHLGSGERLPDAFLTALDRLDGTESPDVGPCGMAAHRATTVLVPDIKTDSRWSAQWRDLALAHGLRACQVVPVLAAERRVAATFVMYRHRPGDAEFADPQLVQVATHLAGIAIARAQADQALRDADTRKDEFLAVLAHELRNPLAPIRNGVHLLRRAGGGDAAIGSIAAMLERQVAQMVRLVEDLLDVSRITRGRIELRRERIELASVVNQAVEAARARIEGMGHALAVTLPPEPIQLDADAARLTQVLHNLLDNACKFTTQGGRIALTVAREGAEAVVRVRDDGIGIPREQLPRIFDLFVQVDTSLERAASGLGIGLTLVKTLVEMHGGAVAAHSEGPGRGSEFVVRLPVADAGAAAPARAAPAPVTAPGRRVLIVDDNPDGAGSLATLLELSGHRTERAHDGVEAVEAAERFRPEVVLLDIGLPKLNGYDVCRRIRAQPWGQDVLLVAVTGLGQDEDERRSREAGFDRHLVKPVDYDALAQLLAALPAADRATRAA